MKHWRFVMAALVFAAAVIGQNRPVLNEQEKAIEDEMRKLRSLPDDEWAKSVASLATRIHALPAGGGKQMLIGSLSHLVTEGDAGQDTLQMVASTLAETRTEMDTLAQLIRYEHVKVSVDNPELRAAMAKLEAEDQRRQSASLTLSDLTGKSWSLRDLRGKVVLVNFWATWCPPCRREMPDMETLYKRFGARGLVILAISDEDRAKVEPFIAERKYSYPILLDPGRKVNEEFGVHGIPKSFVYDRDGKLAAVGIDRRTERQFLAMLKMAGLQ
jgi:peroxiredoxin